MLKLRHNVSTDYSDEAEEVLKLAAELANTQHRNYITASHLAEALILSREGPHTSILRAKFTERKVVLAGE